MYRRNPQGSIEGMVLEELEKGGTPATAFSHLRNLASQETPLGEMVRSQLLPATMQDGSVVEGEYDWRDVMGRIANVQTQMMEAPQLGPVGAVYNDEGNLIQQGGENVTMYDEAGNPIVVRQTTTPSALGEKYAELGLTPPVSSIRSATSPRPRWNRRCRTTRRWARPSTLRGRRSCLARSHRRWVSTSCVVSTWRQPSPAKANRVKAGAVASRTPLADGTSPDSVA
jgi:hypothetical protein